MKHKRRKHRERVSHDRWLVSYADFITLLFAFFVVLYSTAQIDKKKMAQLAAAIQGAFQQMGAFPPSANPALLTNLPLPAKPPLPNQSPLPSMEENGDLTALQQELEQALAHEIVQGEVSVHKGPDGLVVSLREIGFFDSGSAGIKAGSETTFGRIAARLALRPYHIRIEGHTHVVPIHNAQFASNWELSTARSTELVRLLIVKYGFSPDRLSAAGYAQYHPIASNASPDGRAQNRRVDVVILRKENPGPAVSQDQPTPSPVAPQ